MIRDARRELDLAAEGPRPTTTPKKVASGKRQTRAKTAPRGKRKNQPTMKKGAEPKLEEPPQSFWSFG